MWWALRSVEIEPIKSIELHLRLDHEVLTPKHVGGYLKGHPLMKSGNIS